MAPHTPSAVNRVTGPRQPLREAALRISRAALAAGDPRPLLHRAVRVAGSTLTAGSLTLDLGRIRRVLVLGCGKASAWMAEAVEDILGDRVDDGFVVVKDGHTRSLRRVRIAEAGHPVPDARGQAASGELVGLARAAGADDLVLLLISGGGSALTPAPPPPITLDEKREITRLLLGAGATIRELNAVRKHLSLVKGGQLARAAAPARVLTLILSDVIGDPLDVIASGPTAPDPSTFADALQVLERRGVTARVSRAVLDRLRAGARGEIDETPKPGDAVFSRVTNLVIGNNALVIDAAVSEATRLGYAPRVLTRALEGEARDVARELVKRSSESPPRTCLVAGGETTVTVRGMGCGGRCQELALAAALDIQGRQDIVVLAVGTDGTDGPTDAAGAVVDGSTAERAARAGLEAHARLADNDSHAVLGASGDLIVTGPTGTNLLDIYLVLRA
ncbi:MAG: glycerate kinase [Candidatus Rokubacteria bacterium]|nr:glycerate kinase [Candidatus Rokubacteria bacterium]